MKLDAQGNSTEGTTAPTSAGGMSFEYKGGGDADTGELDDASEGVKAGPSDTVAGASAVGLALRAGATGEGETEPEAPEASSTRALLAGAS